MLNYYDPSLINYEYLPTLLRLGGIFNLSDRVINLNEIALFLD